MKRCLLNFVKQSSLRSACAAGIALSCLCSMSCVSHGASGDDLDIYRITNGQAGHEFARTEQFLVPVGSIIVINGLEFEPGVSTLTARQKLIVQDVFNCLEEITENTVNDTNLARVAEHKKMRFEIRGYTDASDRGNATLSKDRAKAVMDWLIYLG